MIRKHCIYFWCFLIFFFYLMKKIFFIALLISSLWSCRKEDSSYDSTKNVVSKTQTIAFEELLLLINLKTSDTSYLVVPNIDSVSLFVNEHHWSTKNSVTIDTSNIEKFISNNRYNTRNKLNYLILAKKSNVNTNFTTAGEYAQYLNSLLELKPGEYACLINSFQIRSIDNSIQTYYPLSYKVFKVEENNYSAFVGEIEIKLY